MGTQISEAPPKKKVDAAAEFVKDLRIIRNVLQRLYRSLAIRKDTLCAPVVGHYLRLENATIILQPE